MVSHLENVKCVGVAKVFGPRLSEFVGKTAQMCWMWIANLAGRLNYRWWAIFLVGGPDYLVQNRFQSFEICSELFAH